MSRIFTIIPQAKNEDLSSASSSKKNLSALGQIPSSGLARPPSHLPHLTHGHQVYLKRWMAGKAVRVSEPCWQFISLRHFLSSCHKGTSFEATRDRKYLSQSEPKDASPSPTRESCVQKGLQPYLLPHFSQGTEGLVPGVSTSAHWYLRKEGTRFLVLRIK